MKTYDLVITPGGKLAVVDKVNDNRKNGSGITASINYLTWSDEKSAWWDLKDLLIIGNIVNNLGF